VDEKSDAPSHQEGSGGMGVEEDLEVGESRR